MSFYVRAALLVLGLLAFAAAAYADTSVGAITTPGYQPMRGTANVGAPLPTEAACWAAARADAETRAATATYRCRRDASARITYTAPPPPCPPQPAAETQTQTCAAPATGTWTQTRTYAAAPSPTCWTVGAWTPTASPAGACVEPPPPPPPPAAATVSVWAGVVLPVMAAAADSGAVNLGMLFRATVDGSVVGMSFYKGAGNNGTHVGSLWSTAGQLLAQGTVADETATGWQRLTFAQPVPIAANTNYIIAYHAPQGRYAADSGYGWPASSGLLIGEMGLYAYAASSAVPTQVWQAANYWVDVLFAPSGPPAPPPTGRATVEWDASTDAAVTGYRVYSRLGQAGYPPSSASIPSPTNSYTFSALAPGRWCFVVTATSATAESPVSNEACKDVP